MWEVWREINNTKTEPIPYFWKFLTKILIHKSIQNWIGNSRSHTGQMTDGISNVQIFHILKKTQYLIWLLIFCKTFKLQSKLFIMFRMRKMCQKSCENVGDVFFLYVFFHFQRKIFFLTKPIISRWKWCKNQNTYMGFKYLVHIWIWNTWEC